MENIHHAWQRRPCLILLREDPLPQAEGPPRGQRRQLAKAAEQLVKLEKVAVSGGHAAKLGGFIRIYPIPNSGWLWLIMVDDIFCL